MHRTTVRILLACVCVMAFCLAASATTMPTTGKFDIYFEISINSTLPADAPISCNFSVFVEGETNVFEETMSVAGTRTGNHATCTVPMYYSWLLSHAGSDMLSLTYTVTDGSSLPYRQSIQSATIPVPASGATHIYVTFVL
jgi:hypothetical protein